MYAAVLLTGIFVFSAQVLVYAFVGPPLPAGDPGHRPRRGRGHRPGRRHRRPLLGGALVTAGIAYPWGFYAFAVAALLAVVALATVPAHVSDPRVPQPVS